MGKSCLARLLTNHLLNEHPVVAFLVRADPGEGGKGEDKCRGPVQGVARACALLDEAQ